MAPHLRSAPISEVLVPDQSLPNGVPSSLAKKLCAARVEKCIRYYALGAPELPDDREKMLISEEAILKCIQVLKRANTETSEESCHARK